MSPESPESPETISGKGREKESGKSGMSIHTGLTGLPQNRTGQTVLPAHPLDHAGVVKIALSQSATDALAALGPHCLIIATMADCTAPEHAQGRMILHCMPLTQERANDAFRIATGKARAQSIKAPSKPAQLPTPEQLKRA